MKIVKTNCGLCMLSCGVNVYVDNGKIVKIEGMPEHPYGSELCPKVRATIELIYSPTRLKHPMKKQKDGTWKRTSWDEALNYIASELKRIKKQYGPEAFGPYCGSVGVENIELSAFAQRFRSVYGSPNFFSVDSTCFHARIMARILTLGRYYIEDPENANCLIVWGHNPDNCHPVKARHIREAVERGAKLIVIDPRRIPLAEKGIYVPIKPGYDCALALGMLNVIVGEELYDKDFVENWAVGFDKLKEHLRAYTPEAVEAITGVPAVTIKKIARVYATTKPACISQGINTQDQQINGIQTSRAFAILQAVTGNVDVRGGWKHVPLVHFTDLRIPMKKEELATGVGLDKHPLFWNIWSRIWTLSQTMYLTDAILEGKIKALIVTGGNPALTLPNSKKVREAFKKLELLVVMDPVMSETAELAHIVLPACTCFEKNGIAYTYGVEGGIPYVMLRKKCIEPLWESWPEWQFWCELGRRMGYEEYFPWKTDEEVIDFLLKESEVNVKYLKNNPSGVFFNQLKYGKYLKRGFATPSKKVEIYSETLEEYGYDPLPTHRPPPQDPEYPLSLITGVREAEYIHTQFRYIFSLHRLNPDPIAEINPVTAKKHDITDGEIVIIETKNGSIKIRVRVTDKIIPSVVAVPHGWSVANENELTDTENLDPISGFPTLKGIPCRIKSTK